MNSQCASEHAVQTQQAPEPQESAKLMPFLSASDSQTPVARDQTGKVIVAQQLVGDIVALAERLPTQSFLVNACHNRYHFAVGLGAALLRQQVSVLPHNQSADTVAIVKQRYGEVFCLTDQANPFVGLRTFPYPFAYPIASGNSHWPAPQFDAGQTAACLSTSGSTGVPSWYERSWGAIATSAKAGAQALGMDGQQRWNVLATVPSQHSYGLESAIFLPLQISALLDCTQPFYPADVLSALNTLPRPRLLVTTPVHLRAIVKSSHAPVQADLVLSATAALSGELAEQAEAFFEARVMEIYGSTESGQTATRRTLDGDLWTPMNGVRYYSADQQTFYADCHIGKAVELADRLVIERSGQIRLLGRNSDMLNVAGKRGSKTYVEAQLLSIDGVHDAAVFNEEKPDSAGRVIAFVVAPTLSRAHLLTQLRIRLEAAFVPRQFHFVAQLPRDGTGKISRREMTKLLAQVGGKSASDN